jgi:DNA-binding beta-propeller fold protein YncE
METRLRELMQTVVGDPPRRVTAEAVRHQVVRRRVQEAAGVLAAVVLAIVGVTAAVRVVSAAPGPAAHHRPAASTAYVTFDSGLVKPGKLTPGRLVPISTATNRPGKPIRLAIDGAVAVTPDGKTIYVGTGGTVTPVRTDTNAPGKPIHIRNGLAPFGIAVAPDGKTAYVSGLGDAITPISTATNKTGKPIHIRLGIFPAVIAFTPDGRTAYVATAGGTVTPINTATNRPGKPIRLRYGLPSGIAVTP